MNAPDCSVPKRLPTSIASSRTTAAGVSTRCASSKAAMRRMFRSTTAIRSTRQFEAALAMSASRRSRSRVTPATSSSANARTSSSTSCSRQNSG